MPAPDAVKQLVQRFEEQHASYQSTRYNETETRRELIDPLFRALGWDVDNSQHYAEAYKDVIHEDAIKIGGVTKAPDYAFRIGGTRKFFVEAKKPSVNVHDDITPAFQLRRYAWTAKLPLSILTDFEEFAVYDCRQKPDRTDKPSTGRILYLKYTDYVDRWDEIAGIFSRDAILKGSFDRYAEETRGKRGTTSVDNAFLAEIEKWRDLLAHNIALRNPDLSQRELNYAVQMTVDRIIFLRICEDRGIEQYGRLQALVNGGGIYPRLVSLFHYADQRYNSGLFHFNPEKGQQDSPDELTTTLLIDDRTLKEIIGGLYYPDSPYEFSVMPANILGQVYEQFLGKVIRLTPGHHAVVEDKPEVKKAGGVYYTPEYIVTYIVKHTVGALLDGKKPGDMGVGRGQPLRVLDPACGSGSFLIGAYQYLLDWYRDGYVDAGPEKWCKGKNPTLYQGRGGEWKLTTAERKRILLDHIYGVDIDSQAVEVTKLSLLLKVLEGESDQTLQNVFDFQKERVLPNLGNNIKCGNSLIGPDFYTQGTQLALFDEEEQYRINAFDWQRAFGDVFLHSGGFDAVIGNPPYGQVVEEKQKKYFADKFFTTEGRFDNFELFIEKAVTICGSGKFIGLIIPTPLFSNLYSRRLRKYILDNCSINEINNFSLDVFQIPTVHTSIILLGKDQKKHKTKIRQKITNIQQLNSNFDLEISPTDLGNNSNNTFDIFIDSRISNLLQKMESKSYLLGNVCYVRQCIKTGDDARYVEIFQELPNEPWKPTLRGRSISRYSINNNNEYVKYGSWLARNWQNRSFYETPKIAIRETGKQIIATFDSENRFFLSSLYAIYPKKKDDEKYLFYLLGILNSKLATFFIKIIALDLTEGAFTKFRTNQLARLPIYTINSSNVHEEKLHDRLVSLVERMLELHRQLHTATLPQQKDLLQRQIDATDREIDTLVYELYGLTAEEIKIVEGESPNHA
ncbi:MAG: N-6 DNA methylase [Leptolinea sp.]|nr:N-6 DNA methylase [Leptolinea sp.]